MFDSAVALKIDLTQDSAEIQDLRNRLKVHLEQLLEKEVDDVVTIYMAEMVVNKQSLGHIAEQLGSVIGEEQTSLLCEWLEKEVRVLNGEAAAVAPAVDSAATAASAPVVVASEVVVRGGDKKSALKEAKPQKPVLEKVGVRAFAQAVDPEQLKKRQAKFGTTKPEAVPVAAAPMDEVLKKRQAKFGLPAAPAVPSDATVDVATGLDLAQKVTSSASKTVSKPSSKRGLEDSGGKVAQKALGSFVVSVDNKQASKAPITIQKKRRQDDSFGVEEPFARGGRASGGAQAFLPPQAMTGMPFGAMDPFALMMAMAASQNLLQGQNGGFGGSSGVHEAQDPSRTRCRFFPKCTKPGCPFVHPSIPCRNGKACTFGRQCLYLHKSDGLPGGGDKSSVPCKFGTRCNKITCPFAHPERFAGAQPSELEVVEEAILSETLPRTP